MKKKRFACAQDHILGEPVGKAPRTTCKLSTATREMRAKARTASHVGTAQLRHKLSETKIVCVNGAWHHQYAGRLTKRFDSVGEAVASL